MTLIIPEISKQIYNQEVEKVLKERYADIGSSWVTLQMEWSNDIYSSFKDHEKYMIVIYLIKRTLDFYSRNFIKLNFVEFYEKDMIEIEKFNIVEISKNLKIPKESSRRKILELEKNSCLKRSKNKNFIDRSAYEFVKPINSIRRISRFLSLFSEYLAEEKILEKKLTTEILQKTIEENFSYVWKLYYEIQIPMMLGYKNFFKDLESFHIWGTCVVNQHLFAKKNYLFIDNKKHYKLTGYLVQKLVPIQNTVLTNLAGFSTKVFNLTIL